MSLAFDIELIPEDQGLDLDQSEKKTSFNVEPSDCSLTQDVQLQGKLTRLGREVFFKGQVKTFLGLSCSRCLEHFEMPVDVGVSACFLPKLKESPKEEEELHEADIEVEYYVENKIDLAQPVYDQILLALPFVHLCRLDCKGLCPACGKNRNVETCGCEEQEEAVDSRLAILKQLKNKMKEEPEG